MSSIGGSADSELTALAVEPKSFPPLWVVMTVTPLAKRPITSRKASEVRRVDTAWAGFPLVTMGMLINSSFWVLAPRMLHCMLQVYHHHTILSRLNLKPAGRWGPASQVTSPRANLALPRLPAL
jgi:hypothetical protein